MKGLVHIRRAIWLRPDHLRKERPRFLALVGVTSREPGDVLIVLWEVCVDLEQVESLCRVAVSLRLGALRVQAERLVDLVALVVLGNVLDRLVGRHASCLKMLQCLESYLGVVDAFEDRDGDSVRN